MENIKKGFRVTPGIKSSLHLLMMQKGYRHISSLVEYICIETIDNNICVKNINGKSEKIYLRMSDNLHDKLDNRYKELNLKSMNDLVNLLLLNYLKI